MTNSEENFSPDLDNSEAISETSEQPIVTNLSSDQDSNNDDKKQDLVEPDLRVNQHYVNTYFWVALTGIALVSGFNFVIDPLRLYGTTTISKVNQDKPLSSESGQRRFKSLELTKASYNTIILGNSRSQFGISPDSKSWQNHQVYSATILGANMYEIDKAYQLARKQQKLDTVVIGLEYTALFDDVAGRSDFSNSGFADRNHLQIYMTSLVNGAVLGQSWTTFLANWQQKKPSFAYLDRGFIRDLRTSGTGYFFRQSLRGQLDYKIKLSQKNNYAKNLAILNNLLRQAHQDNTKVYVFFSPVHAYNLEMSYAFGDFGTFEQLKRDVTNLVAKVNQENQSNNASAKITVWDFSGYSSVNTVPVPTNDTQPPTRYYYDDQHYQPEIGDLVLKVILANGNRPADVPSDFGVMLTPETIENHLQKIRNDGVIYRQNHPEAAVMIEPLVADAKKGLTLVNREKCLNFRQCK
ncbi:MAG: hypothetical protein ACK5QS_01690 [Pseudanabaenaceae cyanobacterium]